jgi:hypothetical protein
MSRPAELSEQSERSPRQSWSTQAPERRASAAHADQGAVRAITAPLLRAARSILPDGLLLRLLHMRRVGGWPNVDHPSTFNEIVLRRCLYPDARWTALTDKLAVRDYVRERVGEEHLVPLLAVPDEFTQDVFDSLPETFVMKANHGCGFVKVVWHKAETSFHELKRIADEWLATDFYRATRERHYRHIERRVYFEQRLADADNRIPADLKLNIFGYGQDGPLIYTGVITDRFGAPRHDFYDPQWNRLDIALGHYACSAQPSPRPSNWDKVVDVATRLSEGLGYVRVDLYVVGEAVYFGELTFTPGAGLTKISPARYDREWGAMIRTMTGA